MYMHNQTFSTFYIEIKGCIIYSTKLVLNAKHQTSIKC